MFGQQFVLHPEEHAALTATTERLVKDAAAKVVFLVDRNGQMITGAGHEPGLLDALDTVSLASLAAGNVAATGGLARLIGEDEFAVVYHQGATQNIHITLAGPRMILVVIFTNESTSLGIVRLRVKKATDELLATLAEVERRMVQTPDAAAPLADITDEDIDNLFKD